MEIKNRAHLWNIVEEILIDQQIDLFCDKLYRSMPIRVATLLKEEGI